MRMPFHPSPSVIAPMNSSSRHGYRPGLFFWVALPVMGYTAWAYYNRHHRRATAGAAMDAGWVDRQNRLSEDVRRSGGGV